MTLIVYYLTIAVADSFYKKIKTEPGQIFIFKVYDHFSWSPLGPEVPRMFG